MRNPLPFLFGALLLCAPSAFADPVLDKCLPLAPKSCALTDKSSSAEIIECFDKNPLKVTTDQSYGCSEELLHAKVHGACAQDITEHCGKVKKGANRTMACLARNHAKLSKPCAGAMERFTGGRKKSRGSGVAAVRC